MPRQMLEGRPAVEIVCVDHGERTLHEGCGAKQGMSSAPGFGSSHLHRHAASRTRHPLKNVFDGEIARKSGGLMIAERCLLFLADNEHDPREPGPNGIVDRVIRQPLPGRPYRLQRFRRSVSRRQPGGEDDKVEVQRECPCDLAVVVGQLELSGPPFELARSGWSSHLWMAGGQDIAGLAALTRQLLVLAVIMSSDECRLSLLLWLRNSQWGSEPTLSV